MHVPVTPPQAQVRLQTGQRALAQSPSLVDLVSLGNAPESWQPYSAPNWAQLAQTENQPGGQRSQLLDGGLRIEGLIYHGHAATYQRDGDGSRQLSLDVPQATQQIGADATSSLARQIGGGQLSLNDGSRANYTVRQGPQGSRDYSLTLPGGRQVEVFADDELASSPQLAPALVATASAFHSLPQSSIVPMRTGLDSIHQVFLMPSLGVRQGMPSLGSAVRPTQALEGGALAVGLDAIQSSADALMMLHQGDPTETQWMRYHSSARVSEQRMSVDDPSLSSYWPANVQIVAGARQGETLPTYAGWLQQALQELPHSRSLPEALAQVAGKTLHAQDDDGLVKAYHPVASTNLGPGWVRGENRPRIALLFTGLIPPGEPNANSANQQVQQLRQSLSQNYPGVQFIQLDQATPDQVQAAMQQMHDFAQSHPGAESMIFTVAHGHTNNADPHSPSDALNGSLEGGLTLAPGPNDKPPPGLRTAYGELSERQLKEWSKSYLGDFSNNLMLFFTCDSGAFIA